MQHTALGYTEHASNGIAGQTFVARPSDHLIEQAHRIAHAAGGFARDDPNRIVVCLHLLDGEHVAQSGRDVGRADQLEVVALAAAQDRDWNLVSLGRSEDELHVRRWLFERLQERVPRGLGEHVNFVDDEDFEAVARRSVRKTFLELAHLVDARIGRAVDFEHVQITAVANLTARIAFEARRRRGPFRAVQRLREDPGARRLAHASDSSKKKGVRNAACRDRVT